MLLVGVSLLSNKVAALVLVQCAVHCETNIYPLWTLISITLCFKAPEGIRSWSVFLDYNFLLKCFL